MKSDIDIKSIIAAAVPALISVVLLYITVGMINKSASAIPDCFGYITDGYGKVTFSEISKIQKADSYPDNIKVNAQSFSSGYVQSVGGMFAPVGILATDENYADFHCVNMPKGSFGGGAAISEDLANKLFKSIDIIGGKFYLSGAEITVAGVYKPENSFLNEICSDGKDYVIVPYSLNLASNDEVDYLYIKDKTGGSLGASDEMELNRLLDGKLDNYKKVNLSENKKIIAQFKHILFFIMGLMVFVVLLGKLLKAVPELINKEAQKNIWFYAKFTLTTAVLATLLIAAPFDLYIPVNFFPADKNILHIRHYADLFAKFVSSHNTGAYYFYDSLYFWSILSITLLTAVNVLVLANVISKILALDTIWKAARPKIKTRQNKLTKSVRADDDE